MSTPSRLCVTVTAPTTAELRVGRDAAWQESGADLVELRLDSVADPDVKRAIAGRAGPVIVTCRPTWEGGQFTGTEDARLGVLLEALDRGAEYVDIEHRAEFAADLIARTGGRGIVLSLHDFHGVPDDLPWLARAMRDTGAEVVKIAITTKCLRDCLPLLDLASGTLSSASKVLIGMGPHGIATRVLASRFGSTWTYAGAMADIGQVSAAGLLNDYRFRSVTDATTLYGLTGSPIAHSVSPAMHNAAFQVADLDAVYLPLPATDADDFMAFAEAFHLGGASVTIPFKVALCERMDEVDAVARRIGAINTVRAAEGRWIGTNTDVSGFLRPLQERGTRLAGLRASILGAGGSARAVAEALLSVGAEVRVHARNASRAQEVASLTSARVGEWPPAAGTWDLLVNCTPIGMHPHVDETPVPSSSFRGGLVYDLVYNPDETRLLREASAAGCDTIGGLDMLVAQAEEQFLWWTGARPGIGVMQAAARARLAEFASHEDHVV